MATFSVSGLVSGINYDDMISKIIAVDSQPITMLQNRQADYNKQISVYGDLSSKLAALKTAAEGLKTTASFYAKTASSSDTTVFDATAASSAAAGNYSITVTALAQAHRIASSPVAADSSTISAVGGNFSFQVGSGAVTTVAVDATTTLAQLRDGINAAKGGAQASIINDGTGYRLVLTSSNSGATNAIVVTENATSLALPTGPVAGGVTLQAAQDAAFSLDTLAMTRSTNTFSDGVGGVTVTLKNEGTGTLSVTNDPSAIRKKIDDFVTAYNAVVSLVSTNSTYNTATHTGGPLTGESTAYDVVSSLQGLIGAQVDGLPDGMRVLSQIGVKTNKDGTLSVDGAVLDDKIATDLSGVSDLFNAADGIANRVYGYADQATNPVDGSISFRTKGLGTTVSNLGDDITKMQDRLTREGDDLRAQFSQLEALLSTISAQSSFLTSLTQTPAK